MSFWKRKPTPVVELPLSPDTIVSVDGREYIIVNSVMSPDHVQITCETVTSFNRRMMISRAPLN